MLWPALWLQLPLTKEGVFGKEDPTGRWLGIPTTVKLILAQKRALKVKHNELPQAYLCYGGGKYTNRFSTIMCISSQKKNLIDDDDSTVDKPQLDKF